MVRLVTMMSIAEYFKGKNVFITGGTGFVGKCLIEKLLRCSPEIGNIFILIRGKKGKSPSERIREITSIPLFEVLKAQQPSAIDKLVPIIGDVTQLGLGISKDDEELLISKVNIIYHGAASIRFDDFLRTAIIVNVRGTREVISLALRCRNLEVFLHISTSYCNIDKSVIDENYYPSCVSWADAIMLAEQVNPHLNALTLKYIAPMPNTYTFTKRIAENVVVDMCEGVIPFVIMRPSIIVSSYIDPIPSWVENLNGPHGLYTAGLKGLVNIGLGDSELQLDCVFVDNVVKALVIAAWRKGTIGKSTKLSIYNVTTDLAWKMDMFKLNVKYIPWTIPLTGMISFNENVTITKNVYYYHLLLYTLHIFPALLIDTALKVIGQKPRLLKPLRKIYISVLALQFFVYNEFTFINDNYVNLEKTLLDSDFADFRFYRKAKELSLTEIIEIAQHSVTGVKKYIFHEPVPVSKSTLNHVKRIYYFGKTVRFFFYTYLLYWLFWKMDVVGVICRRIYNYIDDLDVV